MGFQDLSVPEGLGCLGLPERGTIRCRNHHTALHHLDGVFCLHRHQGTDACSCQLDGALQEILINKGAHPIMDQHNIIVCRMVTQGCESV